MTMSSVKFCHLKDHFTGKAIKSMDSVISYPKNELFLKYIEYPSSKKRSTSRSCRMIKRLFAEISNHQP